MFGFKSRSNKKFTDIDAATLQSQLAGTVPPVLVDVRSPEEFSQGYIAGARLLPLAMIPLRHNELPRDQPIVVVCRSGARSRMACELLAKLGCEDIANLDGGVLGWGSKGFKLIK